MMKANERAAAKFGWSIWLWWLLHWKQVDVSTRYPQDIARYHCKMALWSNNFLHCFAEIYWYKSAESCALLNNRIYPHWKSRWQYQINKISQLLIHCIKWIEATRYELPPKYEGNNPYRSDLWTTSVNVSVGYLQ